MGIVEIVMLLPGRQAARVRRHAAELLVRYLDGDRALVDEVCRDRGFQEALAVRAPEDPRRLFGADVEASTTPSSELARLFSTMDQRLTSQEKLLASIHERLEQDRQRVNLNVRSPKRGSPYQPPIARSLTGAGQPYPVARFLDAKEREDSSWKDVRQSFAPAFSMLVQVLKKKKLKEESGSAVYVEQNHRPQLLYTTEDLEVMETAW